MTATAIKERPIIFSGPMVKAILEGRKKMTRRVLKLQPPCVVGYPVHYESGENGIYLDRRSGGPYVHYKSSPYGEVGSRLVVRETWLQMDRDGWFDPSKPKDWTCPINSRKNAIAYKADSVDEESERCRIELGYKWKSPIHMPRWASRLTLEITDVRVQRLHDIGKDGRHAKDVLAEGITPAEIERHREFFHVDDCPAIAFSHAWEKINGKKHPWASNPWVFALTFKVV